jgi:2-phosphosulfolactate phosphatase
MSTPFDQSFYQVRLERGPEGFRRLAASDVVVLIDVFDTARMSLAAIESGGEPMLVVEPDMLSIVEAAADSIVFAGGLRNASAVADAILAEQVRRGGRVSVALVLCGSALDGRIGMENDLAAGAIADALAARGIDHASPEVAVPCEAFRALRGAVRHLITASGGGRQLAELTERLGAAFDPRAQATIDDTSIVPVLRGRVFVAL